MSARADLSRFQVPPARMGAMSIPDYHEYPTIGRAYEIFQTLKPSVEQFGCKISRDPLFYPVIINGERYTLAKTRSYYVVQTINDWNMGCKTGFCIPIDGNDYICDQKPATIEAVRKYAHAIYSWTRTSRFGGINGL
jgi:hypothetical protein